jgi:hypothetical protein
MILSYGDKNHYQYVENQDNTSSSVSLSRSYREDLGNLKKYNY